MIELTIDGKVLSAREGASILDACRAHRIPVPTLCHHEGVEPYGGCRLCMVEIGHPEWGDWTGLVTSCLYAVKAGLVVQTGSPKVVEVRRQLLDLLLAQAPAAKAVAALARSYGLTQSSYAARDPENKCILCGLCVRVCAAQGPCAIAAQGRGAGKYIGTPFKKEPDACIGCLSCAHICPTGHITYAETPAGRSIWGRTFELLRCGSCGRSHITVAQRDFLTGRTGLGTAYFEPCAECKRLESAKRFASVGTPAAGSIQRERRDAQ
ncbi:MAG: (2Fe-2S)-binding protein [Deltaproteobacteria bacterium]|nr:(2Fe-2S)-binding protein [Deltaproteobacteria bacterium]